MKKFLPLILVLALSGCQSASDDVVTSVKVGIIAPLSGATSSWGESMRNGAEAALAELPADVRNQITVIYEDDALDAARTVTAFNKLSEMDNIDLVFTINSNSANAIAPLAEAKQIPFMAGATDPEIIRDKDWVMCFWIAPEQQVDTLLAEARRRGHKKVAVMGSVHDGVLARMQTLQGNLTDDDFEIVFYQETDPAETDFRTALLQIKDLEVDAILGDLVPPGVGYLARQSHELGLDLPIFGFFLEDQAGLDIAGDTMEGVWYVSSASVDPDFTAQMLEMSAGGSLAAAALAHDLIQMVAQAIQDDATTPAELNDYLHQLAGFQGVMGEINANDHDGFDFPVVIKEVQNGQFVSLEQ